MIERQSHSGEVSNAHDRRFAPDLLECVHVVVVAYPSGRDDIESARADLAIQRKVRTLHRAVALDGGDVKTSHASAHASCQRVFNGEPC